MNSRRIRTSLLTVSGGKAASNGYEMVGLPDGLGATDGPQGRDFTLFMNHEVPLTPPGPGVARRHGQNGAFASEWRIDSDSLEVEEGQDLVDPGVPTGTTRPTSTAPRRPRASPPSSCAGARASSAHPGQLFNENRFLGGGSFPFDAQVHKANPEADKVEYGQLLALRVQDWEKVFDE